MVRTINGCASCEEECERIALESVLRSFSEYGKSDEIVRVKSQSRRLSIKAQRSEMVSGRFRVLRRLTNVETCFDPLEQNASSCVSTGSLKRSTKSLTGLSCSVSRISVCADV